MEKVIVVTDDVYLAKDLSGWRVVHPIKIDGKINWKNLLVGGSYWNLLKIGFMVGTLIFLIWSYAHDIETVRNSCATAFNILA
jgi:hypothetical protein